MADMKFSCPHCQQHIQADAGYAGLQITCPACNGSFLVPGTPPAPAPTAGASPPPNRLVIRSSAAPALPPVLAEATPAAPPTATGAGSCPSCGAAMPRGAVICMQCGYNLITRQRTVAGRPATRGKPRPQSDGAAWYATPWPYLGLVALLLGVFFWLGRQHPPLMLGFSGVVVLYLLTVIILVAVAAFQEGVGTGLLTLCIPFYAIYFVFKVSESDTLKILFGFAVLLMFSLGFLGKFVFS